MTNTFLVLVPQSHSCRGLVAQVHVGEKLLVSMLDF